MTFSTENEYSTLLAPLTDFWEHWGFEPWNHGNLVGVFRNQHLVKDGFLGTIAEFRAWDCIVWNIGTEEDREELWKSARPLPDVMTQRFVFLTESPWAKRRIRSFLLGARGYCEFFAYRPAPEGGTGSGRTDAPDLTDLVDMALKLAATRSKESAPE